MNTSKQTLDSEFNFDLLPLFHAKAALKATAVPTCNLKGLSAPKNNNEGNLRMCNSRDSSTPSKNKRDEL